MTEKNVKYDCFYSLYDKLPVTDERLPDFQKQMLERGWDSTQMWSLDSVLFMFVKDKLENAWNQNKNIKPNDDLLFESIKLNEDDSIMTLDRELSMYFWNWFKLNILKRKSKILEYEQIKIDFFEFLEPRLLRFAEISEEMLVKDKYQNKHLKILKNTNDFLIPIYLNNNKIKDRVNRRKSILMLNNFINNINGLWI